MDNAPAIGPGHITTGVHCASGRRIRAVAAVNQRKMTWTAERPPGSPFAAIPGGAGSVFTALG